MAPDHWSLIPLEFIFTQPWNSPSWKNLRSDISLSPLPAVSASSSMDCGLQFHCGPQGQQASFTPQPCAYLGERTLPTESRTTRECQEIANFGHRMEPSIPSSEASRDSQFTAKSNASIVPCTTQRFVVSYRILCFELETDGSLRWSTQPHVWFHSSSLTYPSHVPCMSDVCLIYVCVCLVYVFVI